MYETDEFDDLEIETIAESQLFEDGECEDDEHFIDGAWNRKSVNF